MKIIFDKLAQAELDDASEYYELEVPRLGSRFREEVKRGIRIIREYPDAWAKEKDQDEIGDEQTRPGLCRREGCSSARYHRP